MGTFVYAQLCAQQFLVNACKNNACQAQRQDTSFYPWFFARCLAHSRCSDMLSELKWSLGKCAPHHLLEGLRQLHKHTLLSFPSCQGSPFLGLLTHPGEPARTGPHTNTSSSPLFPPSPSTRHSGRALGLNSKILTRTFGHLVGSSHMSAHSRASRPRTHYIPVLWPAPCFSAKPLPAAVPTAL